MADRCATHFVYRVQFDHSSKTNYTTYLLRMGIVLYNRVLLLCPYQLRYYTERNHRMIKFVLGHNPLASIQRLEA